MGKKKKQQQQKAREQNQNRRSQPFQHIQKSKWGNLPKVSQRAVALQGLCKRLGSVRADVVAFQAVRQINQTQSNKHNKTNQRTTVKRGRDSQRQNSSGNVLQFSQRAVGLQGPCKSLGSVSANVVVHHSVRGISKTGKPKNDSRKDGITFATFPHSISYRPLTLAQSACCWSARHAQGSWLRQRQSCCRTSCARRKQTKTMKMQTTVF